MTKKKVKLKVSLLALSTMGQETDQAYRYVKFYSQNRKKSVRRLFTATDIADKRLMRTRLIQEGLRLDLSKDDWEEIHKMLSKNPRERVRLCHRPGFVDQTYLTANGMILGKNKGYGPLPYPGSSAFLYDEQMRGSLEDWQKYVANLALYSSRLILALASAFAGPCIHFTDVESGGFHFYASSSKGKSTLMLMAASVFGSSKFVKKWNMTDSAFEEAAQARNHGVFLLDELKLLHKNQSEAAMMAQNRIYMLGSGEGKQRYSGYQKSASRWQLVLLSTGEFSLGQNALAGNLSRLDGERVRVVDVPADAGCEQGIFDKTKENKTPRQIAERIQSQSSLYHGTAGPAFISKLLENDREVVKQHLKKDIELFMTKHQVSGEDGISVRMAKRFALAYASGILAVEYGILPLTAEEIMTGVSHCYHDARGPLALSGSDFTVDFKAAILAPDMPNLKEDKYYTKKDLDGSDGKDGKPIVLTEMKNEKVYAVSKTYFEQHIEGKVKLPEILEILRDNGVLLPDGPGKNTRPVPYQGVQLARRYCLKVDKLKAWLDRESVRMLKVS